MTSDVQPDSGVSALHDIVGCRDCGLVQRLPHWPSRGTLRCRRCDRVLERTHGRSVAAALACAAATLILLFPANLLPLLRVDILQATTQSRIFSGVQGLWLQHWHLVAIVVALELVFLPFVRFGSLTVVLALVRLGRRPPWLGRLYRLSEELDVWAMMDVFLLGGVVGYFRIEPFLPIRIEAGGWCAIAAAFMTLVTRGTLERREVWRRIGPLADEAGTDWISCSACDLPSPPSAEGEACPRCGRKLWRRRPFGTMRAIALTLAAFVFYLPAYLNPMEFSVQLSRAKGYSIMTGVEELIGAHLWFFAILIFAFSVLTPMLKLFALAWCAMSVHRRSKKRLRLKTKLYRFVDGIGRWSHIDVFTVTVFLPLLSLPGFIGVIVGIGLGAFLAVVVLTMLASSLFDARALWRAAELPS